MKNHLPIEIVKADLADIDQLIEISIDTFRETFGGSNSADNMDKYIKESRSREKAVREFTTPGAEFYFAKTGNNDIIGYLKINTGQAQTEPLGDTFLEIERIYVLNRYHGQKAGLQLMEFALQRALEQHKQTIWLGVWEHNIKAIQFYQKSGFVVFDKHSFMLGDDEQTDIMMRKELEKNIIFDPL
jgi:ribosomal protein S18 acetylase RimI-like enzyme